MSFDRSRLDPNSSGSSGVPTQGTYHRPSETLATIAAAGYFSNNDSFDVLRTIGVLRVIASDGLQDYRVTADATERTITLTPLTISSGASVSAVEWSADVNGTITLGGTAQTAVAANPSRIRLRVSVPLSAADSIFIGRGVAAVVGVGDEIGPGGNYDGGYPPDAADKLALSVISATTGVAYTVRQKVVA